MKQLLLFILILVSFTSCTKPVHPEVSRLQAILTVSGMDVYIFTFEGKRYMIYERGGLIAIPDSPAK